MGGGSLLDGDYDEAEQARAFQEALAAWRKGGTSKNAEEEKKEEKVEKKVRFAEDDKEDKKEDIPSKKEEEKPKKSFLLSSFGGEDEEAGQNWNVVELPQFTEKDIGDSLPKVKKESCWQCFKMFPVT